MDPNDFFKISTITLCFNTEEFKSYRIVTTRDLVNYDLILIFEWTITLRTDASVGTFSRDHCINYQVKQTSQCRAESINYILFHTYIHTFQWLILKHSYKNIYLRYGVTFLFFEVLIPDMIVQGVRSSSTIQYVKWQTSGVVVCYFCMYAVCEHEEVEQGGVWKSSRDGDRATGEISINYTLKWSLIIDDIPVRPAISFEMRSSVHSGAAQGSAGMVYVCVCERERQRAVGQTVLALAIAFWWGPSLH